MTIRAIVLDFDGVIVESNQIKHKAFSDLFLQYPDYYDEIMAYHHSHNAVDRHQKFRYIMEQIMKQDYSEKCATLWTSKFADMTRKQIIDCPYVAGAREFLLDLSIHYPIFLASATPLDELKIILEALGILPMFAEVYGAPTKKTRIFEEIAKNEDLRPDEILFIGDSYEDYVSAQQFGCMFIARICDYEFRDEKIERFNDLYQIKAYIIENLMDGGHNGLSDKIVQT